MAPHPGFFHTVKDDDESVQSEELEIPDHFQDPSLAHLRALSLPPPTSGFPQGRPRGLRSSTTKPSPPPRHPAPSRPVRPALSLPKARGRQVSKAARREGVALGPERLPPRSDDDRATEWQCQRAANAGADGQGTGLMLAWTVPAGGGSSQA